MYSFDPYDNINAILIRSQWTTLIIIAIVMALVTILKDLEQTEAVQLIGGAACILGTIAVLTAAVATIWRIWLP